MDVNVCLLGVGCYWTLVISWLQSSVVLKETWSEAEGGGCSSEIVLIEIHIAYNVLVLRYDFSLNCITN